MCFAAFFTALLASAPASIPLTPTADRFAQPVFRLFQPELEIVYEEKNRSLDNKESILVFAVALYPVRQLFVQTLLLGAPFALIHRTGVRINPFNRGFHYTRYLGVN